VFSFSSPRGETRTYTNLSGQSEILIAGDGEGNAAKICNIINTEADLADLHTKFNPGNTKVIVRAQPLWD
jgi:hypothetical protein